MAFPAPRFRFDGSAEKFVVHETNPGDAVAENLQIPKLVAEAIDATISPEITLFATEESDDGDGVNGDGCDSNRTLTGSGNGQRTPLRVGLLR